MSAARSLPPAPDVFAQHWLTLLHPDTKEIEACAAPAWRPKTFRPLSRAGWRAVEVMYPPPVPAVAQDPPPAGLEIVDPSLSADLASSAQPAGFATLAPSAPPPPPSGTVASTAVPPEDESGSAAAPFGSQRTSAGWQSIASPVLPAWPLEGDDADTSSTDRLGF